MSDVELDTKNLDQLIKALKNNLGRGRVGILGAKTVRNDIEVKASTKINATKGTRPKAPFNASTNAGLGAIHEFGAGHIPPRSFLRMPISDNLQKEMESQGLFTKDKLYEVVKTSSIVPWLEIVTNIAEGIVLQAFETGGFGKWPAWKTPGYRNRNNRLLDDTGQLRDSITSEVK